MAYQLSAIQICLFFHQFLPGSTGNITEKAGINEL
jgi:hypothetical protein